MDEVRLQYDGLLLIPTLSGKRVEVIYRMVHRKGSCVNEYRVWCDLEGLATADPHLLSDRAEYIGDSNSTNEETLTSSGACALFDEHYS